MRSSSDGFGQLASALAKAQIELVNPAKTLTGAIDRWGSGNEGQTYRYAPLSAGLDIVRKTLCKHELAVIQTTELDRDSAMVLLTTTLAHGSGEWISATWPVCRTADMSNPKLMGAALTYARRYGLFTLVGIAGEDDLDGPHVPMLDDAETEWGLLRAVPILPRHLSSQTLAELRCPSAPSLTQRTPHPSETPKFQMSDGHAPGAAPGRLARQIAPDCLVTPNASWLSLLTLMACFGGLWRSYRPGTA